MIHIIDKNLSCIALHSHFFKYFLDTLSYVMFYSSLNPSLLPDTGYQLNSQNYRYQKVMRDFLYSVFLYPECINKYMYCYIHIALIHTKSSLKELKKQNYNFNTVMMRLFFVRFSSIILNYVYLKRFPAKSKIPYFLELIFLVVKNI